MHALLLFLFIALAADYPAAGADVLTDREITFAQKLYTAKCAKCHRFYEPMNYAESEWQAWMVKMNQKSKLKGEPASLLGRYLNTYRAGQLPGKPQDKPERTPSGAGVR